VIQPCECCLNVLFCRKMSSTKAISHVGKAGLQKAISECAQSNNVVISDAFAGRLADHLKRHIMARLLAGDKFLLESFGTLKVVTRAGRLNRNPRTGETIVTPNKKTVRFT
jgi:nucleoid DNA-binding protein